MLVRLQYFPNPFILFNTLGQTNKAVWDWLVTCFRGSRWSRPFCGLRGLVAVVSSHASWEAVLEDRLVIELGGLATFLLSFVWLESTTQSGGKLPHKHVPLVKKGTQ